MPNVKYHLVACEVCRGKGRLRARTGRLRTCPECGGGGHYMESEETLMARKGLVKTLSQEVGE